MYILQHVREDTYVHRNELALVPPADCLGKIIHSGSLSKDAIVSQNRSVRAIMSVKSPGPSRLRFTYTQEYYIVQFDNMMEFPYQLIKFRSSAELR